MKAMMKSIAVKMLTGVAATALTVTGITVPRTIGSAQNGAGVSVIADKDILGAETIAEARTVETGLRKAAVETEHADAAAENAENKLAQAAVGDAASASVPAAGTVGGSANDSGAAGGRMEKSSVDPSEERGRNAAEKKAAAEQAESVAAEKAAAEKAEAERLAAEKAAAEQAEAERLAAERAAAEKAETERLAAERAAAEKAEAERVAAEQAEAERLAAEQAQAAEREKYSITVYGEEATLVFGDVGDEQQKVAHYHCNCGYSSTDYEEFTRVHMRQHVLNGDRNSYCTTYE